MSGSATPAEPIRAATAAERLRALLRKPKGLPERRVRIGVRGLIVTDHPLNPPDEVGKVHPWTLVRPVDYRAAAFEAGDSRVTANGRALRLRFADQTEYSTACHAFGAAINRAWRLRTLDIPFEPQPVTRGRAALAVATLAFACAWVLISFILVPLGIEAWEMADQFTPKERFWVGWAVVAGLVTFLVTAGATAAATWSLLRERASPTPRAVRLTREHAYTRGPDGDFVPHRWSELRDARRRNRSTRLTFSDGAVCQLPADDRAHIVFGLAWKEHRGGDSPFIAHQRRAERRFAASVVLFGLLVLPLQQYGAHGHVQFSWTGALQLAFVSVLFAVMILVSPKLLEFQKRWLPKPRDIRASLRRERKSRQDSPKAHARKSPGA